jgi:N-acyl-D-aspartate/D-glutamate deacylase
MIRQAAAAGAQIVCTTECFLDGYAIADKSIPLETYRGLGEPIPGGKYFRRLSKLADELNIHLIAGMLEADGDRRYNTAVIIGPDGKLIGRYHKQKLGHEKVRNTAGSKSPVFRTDFGNVGVMICADRRYKDVVSRFCDRGADFLICPSGGMFGPQTNDPILQARSRENGKYIVFVHPAEFLVTGPDGGIIKRTILGDRLLISPDQIGKQEDGNRVFYFDLPLPKRKTPAYDVLIRGGTLIDGTGKVRFAADLGIGKGRIVAVGDLKAAGAREVIDATDKIVCPGFIDLHSHADRGILQHRAAENYIRQGVTTLLCGNCGSSPTDVAEFFERLRDGGTGPNIALLIGHGSVREKVLGRVNVAPSEKQLEEMRRLVRQAMQDGAVGLSTSLRYGPGAYATTEEVIAVTTEIAPFGGFYATHMRDEGTRILEAMEEAFLIGRKAVVPVHISHHKISSASVFGLTRQTLARIDQVRSAGLDVTLDQYPYGAGSGGMALYVPQSSLSGGLDAFRKRIADPQQKRVIIEAVEELLVRKIFEADQRPGNADDTAAALSRIRVARAKHKPKLEGMTLTQILQSRGTPVTLRNGSLLLIELISRGTRGINHTLDDRPGGDVDRVMQHRLTAVASDGGVFPFGVGNPHPRSYGCYPRVLGHYVRERKLLTLEEAIRKMTSLPARRLGCKERGSIEVGRWADVVVFDPQKIGDRATFIDPHQHSVGVEHVLVRGQFVLRAGKMTDILPGRPLSRNAKR